MSQHVPATAYSHDQAKVYDEQRFTRPSGRRIHQIEFDRLMWALKRMPKGGRALEVGCGTGRLLLDARDAGYRVDGVDGSPDMLEQLRAKLDGRHADLELHTAEAAKLPFDDATYDVVYCIRLLNQTESPAYALDTIQEMIRVAKPGGYVLAEFVNAYRPQINSAHRTTRLKPAQAAARARECGAKVIGYHGAFLLGMKALLATPSPLLPAIDALDRGLSTLLPRLCARSYILVQKAGGA